MDTKLNSWPSGEFCVKFSELLKWARTAVLKGCGCLLYEGVFCTAIGTNIHKYEQIERVEQNYNFKMKLQET